MWFTVSLVTLGSMAFLVRTVRVLRLASKSTAARAGIESAPPV